MSAVNVLTGLVPVRQRRVSRYNTPYSNTGPGNRTAVPWQPKEECGGDQEAGLSLGSCTYTHLFLRKLRVPPVVQLATRGM